MEAVGMGTWEGGVGGPGAPDAVVLSPGQELPPCLETVLVVTTERGCVSASTTGTYWEDTGDAANHPIMYRTAPCPNKE